MFEVSSMPPKRVALFAGVLAMGGTLGGYALHEHNSAQALTAKNEQTTAALKQTQHELADLTSKVNLLVARADAQASAVSPAPTATTGNAPAAPRAHKEDPRIKKLQSQIDAQGDLVTTRSELSGSIAHTHDELVLLQKKGERNYFEFDLSKSKQFEHKGPFGIKLKKANVKHQYADLELIVDDRNLSQKHVNLYQPVMFYTPDSPQPAEMVINEISNNHIRGYISTSKYRRSELASMTSANDAGNAEQPAGEAPAQRKKLPLPQ